MNNPSRWDQINELFEKYKDKYIVPCIVDVINPKSGLAEDIKLFYKVAAQCEKSTLIANKRLLPSRLFMKLVDLARKDKMSMNEAYKKIKIKLESMLRFQ